MIMRCFYVYFVIFNILQSDSTFFFIKNSFVV